MEIIGVIASSRLTAAPEGAQLISTQAINNLNTITFSNLNTLTQYDHLELHWNINSTIGFFQRMRFNGDSSNNYIAKQLIGFTNTSGASVLASDFPGGNSSANRTTDAPLPRLADASPGVTVGYVFIPMFREAVWHSYLSQAGGSRYQGNASDQTFAEFSHGQWNQATAITSLTFFMNTSSTWGPGSTLSLYGWRNT